MRQTLVQHLTRRIGALRRDECVARDGSRNFVAHSLSLSRELARARHTQEATSQIIQYNHTCRRRVPHKNIKTQTRNTKYKIQNTKYKISIPLHRLISRWTDADDRLRWRRLVGLRGRRWWRFRTHFVQINTFRNDDRHAILTDRCDHAGEFRHW